MDEVLKKRIAGAVVLIGFAFIASLLLPEPGQPPRGDGVQRVTIDLNAPPTPQPSAADSSTLPPTIVAPEPGQPVAPPVEREPPRVEIATAAAPEPEPDPPPAATPKPAPSVEKRPAAQKATESKPAAKAEPKPPQEPVLAAVEKEPAPAQKAPEPSPQPKSESKPTAKPSQPAPTPATPAPALVLTEKLNKPAPRLAPPTPVERNWIVQVGSFANIDNARSVQDALKGAGYPSIISPAETARGTLYRVRVGPYAGREEAGAAREKIAALGYGQSAVLKQ